MKKAILIIAILAFTTISFGQTTKSTGTNTIVDTVKKAEPAPKQFEVDQTKKYNVQLTMGQYQALLQTSNAGLYPLLKTTETPMNKLDEIEVGYKELYKDIQRQVDVQIDADRQKFKADSLAKVQPPIKRRK